MRDSLSAAIALFGLLLGMLTVVRAVRGGYRWDATWPAGAGVQIALVLQAILAVVALARGHRPVEPAVFVAYLLVSVAVLPVAGVQVRGQNGRWPGALVALALLVTVVVVARAQTTWRAA